jgi:hypothetical protein
MSGIEFGLAIAGVVGVVDVCYRYGKSLIETCQAVKAADERLAEHIVRIEACWLRIETQLQVIQNLDGVVDERHSAVQGRVLEVLLTKLRTANLKLAGLIKPSSLSALTLRSSNNQAPPATVESRRWKYGLLKDGLIEAIEDLEAWHAVFDPTWFLMMKIANPQVDTRLEAPSRYRPTPTSTTTVVATATTSSAVTATVTTPTTMTATTATAATSTYLPTAKRLRRALQADGNAAGPTVFLRREGIDFDSIRPIPFSCASTARRAGSSSAQPVVLDPVTYSSRPTENALLKDIRNFARKLQHADPLQFGLLECKGILKDGPSSSGGGSDEVTAKVVTKKPAGKSSTTPTGLSFVFRLPATHPQLQGLRWRLLRWGEEDYDSLSDRFALARQLVNAVSYVHIYGFVHKNIRPETVLIIGSNNDGELPPHAKKDADGDEDDDDDNDDDDREETKEYAVLVGFDVVRDADGSTRRIGDDDWEKNVYRHPTRQGQRPEADYEMRHDIYSVGVCLLEIGLWESFIEYHPAEGDHADGTQVVPRPAAKFVKGFCSAMVPGRDPRDGAHMLQDPDLVKDYLLKLTKGRLRRKMGNKYSRVVETCLTCLDEGNADFGDDTEFQDEDGVAVGVRYIEKVTAKLVDIAM